MPRRRFPFRLRHSDSLVMLLAVLTATAFCWVVLALSRGASRPAVAYTIEAPGIRMSAQAAGRMLRETAVGGAEASVVSSASGTSVGVSAVAEWPTGIAAAEELATRLADRLRGLDRAVDERERGEQLANELYQVEVLIRDASARRDADTAATPAGLAAAEEVVRLMRRKQRLLASRDKAPSDAARTASVVVRAHSEPRPAGVERRLAVALLVVLAAAALCRGLYGRGAPRLLAGLLTRQRLGVPTQVIRLAAAASAPSTAIAAANEEDVDQEDSDEPPRQTPRAA